MKNDPRFARAEEARAKRAALARRRRAAAKYSRECRQKKLREARGETESPTTKKTRHRKQPIATTPEAISSSRSHWRRRRLDLDAVFAENEGINQRKIPPPSKFAARNPNNHPALLELGKKDVLCKYCGALHFEGEKNYRKKFSTCCASGQITLPPLKEYPAQFKSWLIDPAEKDKKFRDNLRKYNNAFAFASFGYQSVKFTTGPQAFVIHGQIYHLTSQSLESEERPVYAQLYMLDPEFATQERLHNEHNKDCREDVFEAINTILYQINPFAKAYIMMKDVLKEKGTEDHCVTMYITKDRQVDLRRYNLPVANEVAAVFVSEDGEPPFERDFAVHKKGDKSTQNLSLLSPNCDPMIYPLLFPHGDPGWQLGLPKNKTTLSQETTSSQQAPLSQNDVCNENDRDESQENESKSRHITMLEFYSYRLQERATFNPLIHAGKLTQQFIVDAFLKVEGQRLQWNRMNQQKLRVDLYLGLMDFVNSQAEKQDLKPGRIIILPSSFTGGKRYMQQNYQDAMVMVAKFGKPDLFITFTCNPKWKEITDNLWYNETALDRPDLVATVFYLKLKQFMNDVACDKGGVLGKVKAYMSVIEFQKRGLPHCHMLFFLDEEDKLKSADDVDSVVCAEIPDSSDKELFDIVTTCMLHGPCGENNKNSPCMLEDKGIVKCSKEFPKPFCETTNLNVNGYPLYRRRNGGRKINVRGKEMDNQWVVPYNPYLTRKYSAHINVEVCSSIQSVKYIFKYIYKGHDSALLRMNESNQTSTFDWDEISYFKDTRYISAPEAIWRLDKFDMSNKSHAVERLPVHLPSQQTVVFREGAEEETLRNAEKRGTKLTNWFRLNREDPNARQYLYGDIPYHYVWHASKNQWKPRKRGKDKILPRMYAVSPKDMERFCLRQLLLHIPGALSFEYLRTVDSIAYDTFHEAAKAMKLLEDDKEWERTMDEANIFQMPVQLRQLFAAILIHARPTDALAIYNKYKEAMYEDFVRDHSEYMAEQLSLKDIQDNLEQFGNSLIEFGLPIPTDAYDRCEGINIENEKLEAERLHDMMNAEQKSSFEKIMSAVNGKEGSKCFFLSGAGGCGKTFLYKALTSAVLSQGGLVKAVAPTGLAATLLKDGSTVHRGFGISIHLDKCTVSRFKQGTFEWRQLLKTKLIIWDEISMCHIHLLNAVDRSLRDLLNCDKPFGGIPIVVGGDFQQQAPVVLHGNRVKIVEACVKSGKLWRKFTELKLVQNMRVKSGETDFADWLLTIGSGSGNENDTDFVKLPPEILSNDIVKSVFGNNINDLTKQELASRAILCPKNEDTLLINKSILSLLEGDCKCYLSADSICVSDNDIQSAQYPLEFLNSLTPMGMPPHFLNLKKGCCIMLLRNLNPKKGMCNGTRLIVESLGTNLIECSIFSGSRKGEKVFIPRITLDVQNCDLPFKFKRKQFPVRLAYSMTITKSQGQTFDTIGVYLPEPVFTHGQLYTAFSRVRSKSGLFVQINAGSRQGLIFENNTYSYTYNCVYKEILK